MQKIQCFFFSNDFVKPKRNVFETQFQNTVRVLDSSGELGDLEHKDQFKAQTVDLSKDFDIRLNTSEGKAGPRNLYELLQQGFGKDGKKTTEVLRKLSFAGFETYKSYEGERFVLKDGKLSLYRKAADTAPWYTWDLNQSDDDMKAAFHSFVKSDTRKEARTNLRYIQEEVEPARGKKDALAKWREGLLKETESNSIVGVRRSLAKALGKTDAKAIEEFVSFKARKADWKNEVIPHLDKLKAALKARLPKMDATKIDAVTDTQPYTGSSIQNLLFIEYYRLWEEIPPAPDRPGTGMTDELPPRQSQGGGAGGGQNPEQERPERDFSNVDK